MPAIEASDKPPSSAHVELARILRSAKTAPAMNPKNPAHPIENEIDARFRSAIGPGEARVLAAGIIQVGRPSPKAVAGINALARSAARAGIRVAVDEAAPPGERMGDDLVCTRTGERYRMVSGERIELIQSE